MTTKAVAVIEAETVAPLSEGMARVLDKQIRQAGARWVSEMEKLEQLIHKAAAGQIWVALGLPSLSAYLKSAVQIVPKDKAQRQALAESLSDKGFSNRTTAAILGVSEITVRRDTEGATNVAPDRVEGPDGKTYPKQPKPKKQEPLDVEEVEPPEEPRKATDVINDFRENMQYLEPAVQAFTDLLSDDAELFPKARKRIANSHLNPLTSMIADLQKVVDELMME